MWWGGFFGPKMPDLGEQIEADGGRQIQPGLRQCDRQYDQNVCARCVNIMELAGRRVVMLQHIEKPK
jgi:hypothetical protein